MVDITNIKVLSLGETKECKSTHPNMDTLTWLRWNQTIQVYTPQYGYSDM